MVAFILYLALKLVNKWTANDYIWLFRNSYFWEINGFSNVRYIQVKLFNYKLGFNILMPDGRSKKKIFK